MIQIQVATPVDWKTGGSCMVVRPSLKYLGVFLMLVCDNQSNSGAWSETGRYCWSLPKGCQGAIFLSLALKFVIFFTIQGAWGALWQGVHPHYTSTRVNGNYQTLALRIATNWKMKLCIFACNQVLPFQNNIQLCTQIKLTFGWIAYSNSASRGKQVFIVYSRFFKQGEKAVRKKNWCGIVLNLNTLNYKLPSYVWVGGIPQN